MNEIDLGGAGSRGGGVDGSGSRPRSLTRRSIRGLNVPKDSDRSIRPRCEVYAVPCFTAFAYSRLRRSQSRIDSGLSLKSLKWGVYITATSSG
jgi:hypothetical protein